jgi:mRNA interferase MazF
MLAVDVAKLTSFVGILDEDEIAALDDALKLYHGLL